jgi:hypothetical protein
MTMHGGLEEGEPPLLKPLFDIIGPTRNPPTERLPRE